MMALLFVLDILLVLAFAYALATVARLPSRPAFLVGLFVLAWTDLVLTTEALSLLTLIRPGFMLAAHALLALAAGLSWQLAGRPRPPQGSNPSAAAIRSSLRTDPDLWLLAAVAAVTFGLLAVLNVLVPPNNYDGLSYHLPRVAYWMQHRSLSPWPTLNLRQTTYPPNQEIGSLWSMLFLKSDLLTGFGQWFSGLAVLLSIFGTARSFGSSRRQSAFAALLFATLPMILMQSTAAQNDLAAAALFSAMLYFFLLGLRTPKPGPLILSGVALGLAVGTKVTVPMALPGFAIGAAWTVIRRKPLPIRKVLTWAGAGVAGLALLGAFNYLQNWRAYGTLLGPRDFVQKESGVANGFSWTALRANLGSDLYSLADATGLPRPVAAPVDRWRARGGLLLFRALGISIDSPYLNFHEHRFKFSLPSDLPFEGTSWFGPLGFLLWLPLVLFWSVAGLAKGDDRFLPAVTFLGFMVIIALVVPWSPYRGRYYCLAMACTAPLLAGLYSRRLALIPVRWLLVAIACLTVLVTMGGNANKPLVGKDAIWTKTRIERRLVNLETLKPAYRRLERLIPREATLAAVLSDPDLEYPLFGERLSRKVFPILNRPAVIDFDWLLKLPFRYIVIEYPMEDFPPNNEFDIVEVWPFKVVRRLTFVRMKGEPVPTAADRHVP